MAHCGHRPDGESPGIEVRKECMVFVTPHVPGSHPFHMLDGTLRALRNDQERWLIEVSCFDRHRPRAQADGVVAAEGWSRAASLRREGASCHQG
jgi:hypothetical protein